MFGGLGPGELIVIFMVVLLILGAWLLPPRVPPSAAAVVTPRERRKSTIALTVLLAAGSSGCAPESTPFTPDDFVRELVVSGSTFETASSGRVPVSDVTVFLEDYFGEIVGTVQSDKDGRYSVRQPAGLKCPCSMQLEAEKGGFNRSLQVAGSISGSTRIDIEMYRTR